MGFQILLAPGTSIFGKGIGLIRNFGMGLNGGVKARKPLYFLNFPRAGIWPILGERFGWAKKLSFYFNFQGGGKVGDYPTNYWPLVGAYLKEGFLINPFKKA